VTHENKPPKSKKPNYKQQPRKFQDKPVLTTSSTLHKECRFCGYKHENKKEKCPAWGKTCNSCKGRNHFKSKCKKVNVNSDSALDDSDDDCWLNAIDAVSEKSISVVEANVDKKVTALMNVNDCEVRFQLDSAADVNTICKNFVRKNQVRPTSITLRMWNKTPMKPLGEANLTVKNPSTGDERIVALIVVPNGLANLLGFRTVQNMGLITVNNDRFIANVVVQEIGDLGVATLQVNDEVKPKTLPCRKLPLSLQDDVKREIDKLVERNVLVPVTEPTEWVSQMTVVRKSNGILRICIDPQPLNIALMGEHYRLTTLEDVLPKLADARIFSKLDIREAYWHVKLSENSSRLTTMVTPFGQCRWARLPFGLNVSSEIFQRKLTEAVGDLNGTFTIADDISIAGCGQTDEEAKRDHKTKLCKFARCKEQNIILTDEKKEIGLKEIIFHGHKITSDGVKVYDKNVNAIREMPTPTDVAGVKRLEWCSTWQNSYLISQRRWNRYTN
jgi:hypothetical protein